MPKPADSCGRCGKFLISTGDPPPALSQFSPSICNRFPRGPGAHERGWSGPSAEQSSGPADPRGRAPAGHGTFRSAPAAAGTSGETFPQPAAPSGTRGHKTLPGARGASAPLGGGFCCLPPLPARLGSPGGAGGVTQPHPAPPSPIQPQPGPAATAVPQLGSGAAGEGKGAPSVLHRPGGVSWAVWGG